MSSQDKISQAVTVLRAGGLVAIPTETVYGLGADARNPAALRKIFSAKGRPEDHPLIVHLGDVAQIAEWAQDISDDAKLLATSFWPGPLTLILKKAAGVSDLVTGNQATIGVRVPNHPVALALLKAFGGGLAAPSANRFGRISPTTAQAVFEELGDSVDLILEGGACEVGVESTIVDVSGDTPVILRPGMITVKQIENILKKPVMQAKQNAPRVSGSLESHYAPQTKTRLIATDQIEKFLSELAENELPAVVLTRQEMHFGKNILCVRMADHAKKYAHDLYQILRDIDKKNFRLIIIEDVPAEGDWVAIRDRLVRASH